MAFKAGGMRVKGLDEAIAALHRLDVTTQDALKLAARAGAAPIVQSLARHAPKKTHRLERSVKVRNVRTRGPIAKADIVGAFWGRYQDQGTVNMEANPFVDAALAEATPKALSEVGRVWFQVIGRVIARGAA